MIRAFNHQLTHFLLLFSKGCKCSTKKKLSRKSDYPPWFSKELRRKLRYHRLYKQKLDMPIDTQDIVNVVYWRNDRIGKIATSR